MRAVHILYCIRVQVVPLISVGDPFSNPLWMLIFVDKQICHWPLNPLEAKVVFSDPVTSGGFSEACRGSMKVLIAFESF